MRCEIAFAVVPLTIVVVELPLRTLLMFAIRFTALLPAGFLAATITAIAVARITTADGKMLSFTRYAGLGNQSVWTLQVDARGEGPRRRTTVSPDRRGLPSQFEDLNNRFDCSGGL